jgi:hypothetical protein
MPNRIIKESVCTSDSIDQLGWFEEVLFYRLIVNCDDFGRFDGRTAVIKNRLFPLKDNLTLKNVESAINKLARVGLVVPYESGGKPFLSLPTWNEHQSVRAKRSRYPEPESICKQLQSDDSKCPRNPIQSESNSKSESESKPARVREEEFERFWKCYPRKEGKEKARTAFGKVGVPLETLLTAVEQHKKSEQWQKDGGKFIPHPATWLNGKRWEDEMNCTKTAGRTLDDDEIAAIRRMMESN